MKLKIRHILISFFTIMAFTGSKGIAQEFVTGLPSRIIADRQSVPPPVTLTLPFFDDFAYRGPYPDPALWTSRDAYINNHLAIAPVSWGVATLDALDEHGTPYDTANRNAKVWADTLMSHYIDLSSYQPGDNVVLSFYIQDGGAGFLPPSGDSIYVFFRNDNGIWERMWRSGLQSTRDFVHVMIHADDSRFLHKEFAFMFVNRATKGLNNSQWHIDYVYMDANRNITTNDINDLAITDASTTLLQRYHSMPFRHFIRNPSQYLAPSLHLTVRNNTGNSAVIPYSYTLTYNTQTLMQSNGNSNTTAQNAGTNSLDNIPAAAFGSIQADTFTINGTYNITDAVNTQFTNNNTLRIPYHFGNYFAHDDGTPELSYFVTMHQSYNIPALTAVKYNLEVPDTIRGFSILLPQEVPIPRNKEFGIRIYRDIAVNGGQDDEVYEELYIYPQFNDTIFEMVHYKLERPVALPAGTFYMALVQPAGGFSDSLFVGLDISNDATQERYFSVVGSWEPSLLPGSLLFRPIVGPDFILSAGELAGQQQAALFPNPTGGRLYIPGNMPADKAVIYNSTGQVAGQAVPADGSIDLAFLPPGIYYVQLLYRNSSYPVQKIVRE